MDGYTVETTSTRQLGFGGEPGKLNLTSSSSVLTFIAKLGLSRSSLSVLGDTRYLSLPSFRLSHLVVDSVRQKARPLALIETFVYEGLCQLHATAFKKVHTDNACLLWSTLFGSFSSSLPNEANTSWSDCRSGAEQLERFLLTG